MTRLRRAFLLSSLLARFAAVSALAVIALGGVLFHVLDSSIRSRALASARQSAVLTARAVVGPHVTRAGLEEGLTPRQVSELDREVGQGLRSAGITRLKLWNRHGRVVYSDDRALVGRSFPVSDELDEAFDGEIASEVSDLEKAENVAERSDGQLLEVYVPLQIDGSVVGASEIYVPYAPVLASIRHDVAKLGLTLALGLLLLWATLFRLVASASKRLRRQSEENRHLALHDSLTGLPNRTLFLDRAEQAILAAKRDAADAAVLILDIDRFKEINDTLGHGAGDYLLSQVEPRIRPVLREGDTIARFGADEFAVLLPRLDSPDTATSVARRLRRALDHPILIEDLPLAVEATVGIAISPEHADSAALLVRRADVALHVAKAARSGFEVYSPKIDAHSKPRLSLLGELRRGIAEGELTLHYQPQLDAASGVLERVEALVRWVHPGRGLLPPAEFLPLAEQTRLIRPLTRWVIDRALADWRAWQADGLDVGVAVNLSARSLGDEELPLELATLLAEHGAPPGTLTLELTESAVMADPFRAASILGRLSRMGVRLALDDFGTGYSSLAYLKRLPVDELKIDRSFVAHMDADTDDAAIVRSTIGLARSLRLSTVAEGVETPDALATLRAFGCESVQGFLFAKPLPAGEIREWARRHETSTSDVGQATA
jgi:diguanylate cyclase (GGDEF)-like protein